MNTQKPLSVKMHRNGKITRDGITVARYQRLSIPGYEIRIVNGPTLHCHRHAGIKQMVEANLAREPERTTVNHPKGIL